MANLSTTMAMLRGGGSGALLEGEARDFWVGRAHCFKLQNSRYFVKKMRAKVQPKIHPYSVPKSEVPVQKNPTIAPSTYQLALNDSPLGRVKVAFPYSILTSSENRNASKFPTECDQTSREGVHTITTQTNPTKKIIENRKDKASDNIEYSY